MGTIRVGRILVTALLTLLIIGVGGAVSYWVYDAQKKSLLRDASEDLVEAREAFVRNLDSIFEPVLALRQSIVDSDIRSREGDELVDLFSGLTTGTIRHFEQVNGAFLGFPDGSFLHLQDLGVPGAANGMSDQVRRRIIDRPDQDRVGRWQSFEPGSHSWTAVTVDAKRYDPRVRPWYSRAVQAGEVIWTDPYIFASSGLLGVTFAQPIRSADGDLWAVLGVDLSLGSLSQTLVDTANALADTSDVVFATDFGDRILGHPDFVAFAEEMNADVEAFLQRYENEESFENVLLRSLATPDRLVTVESGEHSFLATKAELNPDRAMPMQIYIARDYDSIFASAVTTVQRNVVLVFLAVVVLGVVSSYAVKLRVEVSARQAAEQEALEAREVAEAATKAKSTFLATMSHEIRTPMNGVMSMTELLTLTRLNSEQRDMAKIINDSANALLTIINDILDFSKIEAGKLEIETVPFSLMDVVNGSAELLAPRAEARDLDLVVDIDPSLVDARSGDPTRIRQILLNLGGNAIKFTESGGVVIAVRGIADRPDWLRFEVTDTGIGLTREQQGKLFQAFVQADSSTSRKFGGTGLGLSICQRLSELMGGRIGVDSEIGAGSTFWFELPMEPLADSPPRSEHDLSAARVALVGLSETVEPLARAYLEATGIGSIHVLPSVAAAAKDAGADGTRVGGTPAAFDLFILDAAATDLDADVLASLADRAAVALVGKRSTLSHLPADAKARATVLLGLPLSRPPLWRAVAIGLGLVAPDQTAIETREDMAYSAPDADTARAADALVLVAEDNETNRVVIRQILDRMGFACEMAENGRVALERLQRPGHGLLLTDFNMPEMDGFELTRAVRAGEAERGDERLPIVALTADAMEGTEAACYEAGMDGFLTKPIDSHKLGAVLVRHLPQALPLRAPAAQEVDRIEPAKAAASDWDPDVFDAETLAGQLGGLDAETKELIASAAQSWDGKVDEVLHALEAGDPKRARAAAHSLKGAALSVGAIRLGRIAADIQDALDAEDTEMAALMADVLRPTLEEFNDTLPKILAA